MAISLTRMLQSFGQAQDDLPTIAATNAQRRVSSQSLEDNVVEDTESSNETSTLTAPERVNRLCQALAQVNDSHSPTPLTDRYLTNKAQMRSPNRPPFDPNTLWYLKHGHCPIMTELVDVVDEATLNAMPIEAVAVLDRINGKLKRYRDWSQELNEQQQQQHNERQFVIDKLVTESIPEAIHHYEQLLRFSPHRTKNNTVQGSMTAGDMLTDLFLEVDYELDELLDELHQTVLNRLASTHRYVKSRTQN
ncbi:hypothetical protein [uncultured Psychrobacter sp.]|uniref:hypothetical protein n=1 Tax=uncultured Psychrobacter sp. TaxID=259303 RepID=UPI003458AA00